MNEGKGICAESYLQKTDLRGTGVMFGQREKRKNIKAVNTNRPQKQRSESGINNSKFIWMLENYQHAGQCRRACNSSALQLGWRLCHSFCDPVLDWLADIMKNLLNWKYGLQDHVNLQVRKSLLLQMGALADRPCSILLVMAEVSSVFYITLNTPHRMHVSWFVAATALIFCMCKVSAFHTAHSWPLHHTKAKPIVSAFHISYEFKAKALGYLGLPSGGSDGKESAYIPWKRE